MECNVRKLKDKKNVLCTLNTKSKLDNMSNTHKIISKAQKVTYTQKQHSKNHTSPPL